MHAGQRRLTPDAVNLVSGSTGWCLSQRRSSTWHMTSSFLLVDGRPSKHAACPDVGLSVQCCGGRGLRSMRVRSCRWWCATMPIWRTRLFGMRSRLGPEASGVHASCRRAVCDREAVLQPESVPGRRACPSAPGTGPGAEFRPDRFRDLSPDGRLLVIDWARRAEETLTRAASRGPNGQGSPRRSRYMFEAFIYA